MKAIYVQAILAVLVFVMLWLVSGTVDNLRDTVERLQVENDSLKQEIINFDLGWYRITTDTIYAGENYDIPIMKERTYKRIVIDSFSYEIIELNETEDTTVSTTDDEKQ